MSSPAPRKRHSPAVYRRRRLVLLLGVLAVAALVTWLLIAQPWQGLANDTKDETTTQVAPDSTATSLPVPEGSSTPEATASGSASEDEAADASAAPASSAAPCVASDITVLPVTDQEAYGEGENPQFSISLTNKGEDCAMNVGTSTQVFTVMSGEDTWWTSTDCQTEPSDMVVVIPAGETVESAAPLEWDRTRSTVGTCTSEDRQRASGGGSSYFLLVEIGGIASNDSAQFMLY